MFKLAVFTDEVSQDFARAVDFAGKFGLDGLEIRSVWDTPPQDQGPEIRRKMDEALKGTGLEIASIASPFYKCKIDDEADRRRHLEILRRSIDLGRHFGTKIVRGFTFWKLDDVEANWARILDLFEEPVKILEAEDAILGIENESSTNHGGGAIVRRFIDDVGSPRVKAIWDPANSVHFGEVPYPDGYEHVKDLLCHVHLKDARVNPQTGKHENCPVGEGEIDIAGQFVALATDGYDGYVSLETHWRPKALDEETLNRPGGSTFSLNAETASRICLQNIHAMLTDLNLEV